MTLLLLAMAFAMTGSLVRNFSNASAQLEGKEGTQQGSLVLLSVAAELEEAFEVVSPAPDSTTPVTEILLKKYAPTPERLEVATIRSSWPPDYVIQVRYRQIGEDLVREANYTDGTRRLSKLAGRISGFSAKRLGKQTLEVRVTFRESKKLETTAVFAHRWGD